MADRIVSIRLDPDARAKLDARVEAAGTTQSDVIRALILADDPGYLWYAYYPDFSGVAAFPNEVEALRHAVAHGMEVLRVPHGIHLQTAVHAKFEEQRNR